MQSDQSPTTTSEPAQEPAQLSYAERRLQEAGIEPDRNMYRGFDPTSVESERRAVWKIFASDKDDNLRILYPTLSGEVEVYDNGTKNKPHSIFYRTRLKEPRVYLDKDGQPQSQKYEQPRGTRSLPFYNPGLVAKFQKGEKIQTLYLVEGELKSYAGYVRGMHVVGLPSMTVPKDSGGGNFKLEASLIGLIKKCQVETIVLLHDADALTVNWAATKDLGKRPGSFAAAVISFREGLQPLIDDEECALQRAYYMHGRRELLDKDAKGLDDLFFTHRDFQKEILADLGKHDMATVYFAGINITTPHYDKIRSYFGINRKVKGAEQVFYEQYKADIGNREFVLWGWRYQHNGEVVQYLAHEEAGRYARVGSDWYKYIYQVNSAGEMHESLEAWKVGEISRDYKKYPNFLDECPKYDGFTVEPAFNGNYQRVIHNNLNLVTPLTYQPAPGAIDNTVAFLKHIFGGTATLEDGKEADTFTVALDWLTVAHNHPKHQLPVIILVSKENKTGKTTFLNWLNWIYGNNATVLNNAQFAMKFNAHYATKFIIGLDEAFQDLDKKAEKERLKQMVTGKEMYIERKGVDLKKVPFYAKIVMTSNDEDKVMKIDDGETRWFVVKVPVFREEDVDMEAKLRAEIPAWLHYMHQRKIFHERKSRLWFRPEDFITEQFKKIVESTKNRLDKAVEEYIKEQFLLYHIDSLRYPLKHLLQEINSTGKYRIDEIDLKAFLKKRGMEPEARPLRIRWPIGFLETVNKAGLPELAYSVPNVHRHYRFNVMDWLDENELEQFARPLEIEQEEEPNKAPF